MGRRGAGVHIQADTPQKKLKPLAVEMQVHERAGRINVNGEHIVGTQGKPGAGRNAEFPGKFIVPAPFHRPIIKSTINLVMPNSLYSSDNTPDQMVMWRRLSIQAAGI